MAVVPGKVLFISLCVVQICILVYMLTLHNKSKLYSISLRNSSPEYNLGESDIPQERFFVENSDCEGLEFPVFSRLHKDWFNVTSEGIAYVYSAYRDGDHIRIISAAWRKKIAMTQSLLFCQIWVKNKLGSVTMISANVSIIYLPEVHKKKFIATFFMCSVLTSLQPFAVSVVINNPCAKPLHTLPMASSSRSLPGKFTLCVAPLHQNVSLVYELINSIEFNRILGADFFVFYNHSLNYVTSKVLSYYSKKGLVEVLPWKIPIDNTLIHYYGQMAAVNDCVYRHRDTTDFVVIEDLDEFILPVNETDTTWHDILKRLPKASSYTFRHAAFRLDWDNNKTDQLDSTIIDKYRLLVFNKIEREPISPQRYRAKTILNPKVSNMTGVHVVWEHTEGELFYVDPSVALLHHYRNRTGLPYTIERVTDERALKYKDIVVDNVQNVWQDIMRTN